MSDGQYLNELWPEIHKHLLDKISIGEVEFLGHAKIRGELRQISKETSLSIIKENPIEEMYKEREYPYGEQKFQNRDPVFTISGTLSDGFTVAIPFAIKLDYTEGKLTMKFYPITVIHTNKGRHVKKQIYTS